MAHLLRQTWVNSSSTTMTSPTGTTSQGPRHTTPRAAVLEQEMRLILMQTISITTSQDQAIILSMIPANYLVLELLAYSHRPRLHLLPSRKGIPELRITLVTEVITVHILQVAKDEMVHPMVCKTRQMRILQIGRGKSRRQILHNRQNATGSVKRTTIYPSTRGISPRSRKLTGKSNLPYAPALLLMRVVHSRRW